MDNIISSPFDFGLLPFNIVRNRFTPGMQVGSNQTLEKLSLLWLSKT